MEECDTYHERDTVLWHDWEGGFWTQTAWVWTMVWSPTSYVKLCNLNYLTFLPHLLPYIMGPVVPSPRAIQRAVRRGVSNSKVFLLVTHFYAIVSVCLRLFWSHSALCTIHSELEACGEIRTPSCVLQPLINSHNHLTSLCLGFLLHLNEHRKFHNSRDLISLVQHGTVPAT